MSAPGTRTLSYRPDLDGLRALAVLAVLIFHVAPEVLTGGFVGVDVFFVLSGFLIASITFAELDRGTYSFLQFYGRRVRRLLPALNVVVPATLIAGAVVMSGDEFALLGKHVVAAVTFVSNFTLWREAGYFDASSELKPLLHLWSLAVEEHFYLVWPIFIAAVARFRLRRGRWIGAASVASFGLGLVAIAYGRAAGFYLSPARFWEILLGSALAARSTSSDSSPRGREVAAIAGLSLLVAAFVWLTGARRFPGFTALWPTIAAALLIWSGPTTVVARRFLNLPAMVAIGRISYPLYLWHWPVIVFMRLVAPALRATFEFRAFAVTASLTLAFATYRLVESPALRRMNPRGSAWWLLAPWVGFGLIGGLVLGQGGFPIRNPEFSERMRKLESPLANAGVDATCPSELGGQLNFCRRTNSHAPTHAVIGDSHANHLFHGLREADSGHGWLLMGHGHCPPVLGLALDGAVSDCDRKMTMILDVLRRDPDIRTVALAFYGYYDDFTERGRFDGGLQRVITQLKRAGKRIVIVADVPELAFDPRDCIARPASFELPLECAQSRSSVDAHRERMMNSLAALERANRDVRIYDPLAALCDDERCYAQRDGQVLYLDEHHLSDDGSAFVGREFVKWLTSPRR